MGRTKNFNANISGSNKKKDAKQIMSTKIERESVKNLKRLKVNLNKFSNEYKTRAKSKLEIWKQKQLLAKRLSETKTTTDVEVAALSPKKRPEPTKRQRKSPKKRLSKKSQTFLKKSLESTSTGPYCEFSLKSPINSPVTNTKPSIHPDFKGTSVETDDSDVEIIDEHLSVIVLDEDSVDLGVTSASNDLTIIEREPDHLVLHNSPSLNANVVASFENILINKPETIGSNDIISQENDTDMFGSNITKNATEARNNITEQEEANSVVMQPEKPSTTLFVDTSALLATSTVARAAQRSDSNSLFEIVDESSIKDGSNLYTIDKCGIQEGNIIPIPLYEPISDDSFSFDSTLTPHIKRNMHSKNSEMPIIDLANTSITFSSPIMPKPKSKPKRKLSNQMDDSVIFVSETLPAGLNKGSQDFISIGKLVRSPSKRNRNKTKRLQKKSPQKLYLPNGRKNMTCNSKKKSDSNIVPLIQQSSSFGDTKNSYNPNKEDTTNNPKRMIILDGSNVAFGHSMNNSFSVRGIVICMEFFEREGHEVKAVLPQMRLKQSMSTDPGLLESLHREGKVILTPCKNLPGRSVNSYDDRFILDLAIEFDAAIISNDNYRDLLRENETKYRGVIETRVIGYTWCKDMIMFPKDPYGRNGPTLDDILNRKT